MDKVENKGRFGQGARRARVCDTLGTSRRQSDGQRSFTGPV